MAFWNQPKSVDVGPCCYGHVLAAVYAVGYRGGRDVLAHGVMPRYLPAAASSATRFPSSSPKKITPPAVDTVPAQASPGPGIGYSSASSVAGDPMRAGRIGQE